MWGGECPLEVEELISTDEYECYRDPLIPGNVSRRVLTIFASQFACEVAAPPIFRQVLQSPST